MSRAGRCPGSAHSNRAVPLRWWTTISAAYFSLRLRLDLTWRRAPRIEDQTTKGSITSRIDGYLNRDAFQSSGVAFGSLGRNTVIGPDQRRVNISVSKMTRLKEGISLEFRAEAYNVSNTPTFRNPARDLSGGNFGEITRTRGGPRVIQLGLKLRF